MPVSSTHWGRELAEHIPIKTSLQSFSTIIISYVKIVKFATCNVASQKFPIETISQNSINVSISFVKLDKIHVISSQHRAVWLRSLYKGKKMILQVSTYIDLSWLFSSQFLIY